MRLVKARQAPSGSGFYHTLAVRDQSQTLASASWYMSNRETHLASQWVGMTNELSTSWSWFNAFLSSVATFIGSDPALDLAMKFTLHSYADFKKKWHSVYDHSAQISGIQAMKALRYSINNSSHTENHAQLAIAAGLCSIAEVCNSRSQRITLLTLDRFSEALEGYYLTLCTYVLARGSLRYMQSLPNSAT